MRTSKKQMAREREIVRMQAALDLVAREDTSLWSAEHPGCAGRANELRRALYAEKGAPAAQARQFLARPEIAEKVRAIVVRSRKDVAKHDAKGDKIGDWIRSGSWWTMIGYAAEVVGI